MRSNTQDHYNGAAGEYTAAAFFLANGYGVYWPSVTQSRHDFVIEKDGEFQKVQVKTAREVRDKHRAYVRVRLEKTSRGSRKYEPEDFDLLVVVYDPHMWVFPYEELPSLKSLTVMKSTNTRWRFNPNTWKVKGGNI